MSMSRLALGASAWEYNALVTTQQRETVYSVEEPEAGLSHGSRENRAQRVGGSLPFPKSHSHQADFLLLGSEHLPPTVERSRIARKPGLREPAHSPASTPAPKPHRYVVAPR